MCYEAKQLFFELQELGYQGSYATVACYARASPKSDSELNQDKNLLSQNQGLFLMTLNYL